MKLAYALWLPAVVAQLFVTTPGVSEVAEPVDALTFATYAPPFVFS